MSTPSQTYADSGLSPDGAAPAAPLRPNTFYWSVRRELWESRSITLAPVIAGALVLFGFALGQLGKGKLTIETPTGVVHQGFPPIAPFLIAGMAILIAGLVAGLFYALGALYGERRDRSVLFWKSLPVSDLTTVLAKASVPLVVIPVVSFALIVLVQAAMLVIATAAALAARQDPAVLWREAPFPTIAGDFAYGLAALALWQAPVWGWLLMVSAWARRSPILWAAGVPVGLCLVERMAFDTGHLWGIFTSRLFNGAADAFQGVPGQALPRPDPLAFVVNPGLWIGLVVAAVFLGVTVWLRRRGEPM